MRDKIRWMWLFALIIVCVSVILTVDGAFSPAVAVDRWVGTAIIGGFPVVFAVLVNPGVGASWQWVAGNVVVGTGPLSAAVSGSNVTGTLFTTGGAIYQPNVCCAPCNFSGTISANQVSGRFDPVSCGGTGTFVLIKQ